LKRERDELAGAKQTLKTECESISRQLEAKSAELNDLKQQALQI